MHRSHHLKLSTYYIFQFFLNLMLTLFGSNNDIIPGKHMHTTHALMNRKYDSAFIIWSCYDSIKSFFDAGIVKSIADNKQIEADGENEDSSSVVDCCCCSVWITKQCPIFRYKAICMSLKAVALVSIARYHHLCLILSIHIQTYACLNLCERCPSLYRSRGPLA